MDVKQLIHKVKGPWSQDLKAYPLNEYRFTSRVGYECLLMRNTVSVWCGYVILPSVHMMRGDIDEYITVHGGITYQTRRMIGFDCAHLGDLSPLSEAMMNYTDTDYVISSKLKYWSYEDVREETEILAENLRYLEIE